MLIEELDEYRSIAPIRASVRARPQPRITLADIRYYFQFKNLRFSGNIDREYNNSVRHSTGSKDSQDGKYTPHDAYGPPSIQSLQLGPLDGDLQHRLLPRVLHQVANAVQSGRVRLWRDRSLQ